MEYSRDDDSLDAELRRLLQSSPRQTARFTKLAYIRLRPYAASTKDSIASPRFAHLINPNRVTHQAINEMLSYANPIRSPIAFGKRRIWLRTKDALRKHVKDSERLPALRIGCDVDAVESRSPAVDEQIRYSELVDFIKSCLTASEARLFTLKYLDQIPHRDIAKALELCDSTISRRVDKLQRKLREHLSCPTYES